MRALGFFATLSGLALIFTLTAFAQPDSLWSRTFGGSSTEYCYSVQPTLDSGYILAGRTHSLGAGQVDFWIVKTDSEGGILWSRTLGGDDTEGSYCVQQTSDTGYISGGWTNSFGAGHDDIWLVKLDGNGDSLWSRTFGGSSADECYSVQQTWDGGYMLAGLTWSFGAGNCDFWLVKTDANGDSLWSRTFGGDVFEWCLSAQQTSDGGYALAGGTSSFGAGDFDFWLVKTDSIGDSLWSRTFGGSESDYCSSISQTSDGGYILAGMTASFGAGHEDFWLLRTDVNGDSLWSRTFGAGSRDQCYSMRQTADSGFILAGLTESFGAGHEDFWVVKTNAMGNDIWNCTFGGNERDECHSVQQSSDGGYILAGYTWSFGAGNNDFWLVKTGPELAAEPLENPFPTKYTLHQNWPNPFNPSTRIVYDLTTTSYVSLKVFDLLGREVRTLVDEAQPMGSHSVLFDGSELASGMYLCRLQGGDFTTTKKMILLK